MDYRHQQSARVLEQNVPTNGVDTLDGIESYYVGNLPEEMRLSEEQLFRLYDEDRLIMLPGWDAYTHVPTFQFDEGFAAYSGLGRILPHFQGAKNPFSVARWFLTPNRKLGRLSPAEILHTEGDVDAVERAALSVAPALVRRTQASQRRTHSGLLI